MFQNRGARFDLNANRVEEVVMRNLEAEALQAVSEFARQPLDSFCDRAQAARAVINRIHGRDDGEKDLGRANVARGFVAPDVLLARLQGEAIGGSAFDVMGNANQTTGHVSFVLIAGRKISGVRSAKAERNTE